MTDKEYDALCNALFGELEALLEEAGEDFDNNGSVLEIISDDDDTIVINRQPPKHEVWLAARSGGRHFRHVDGQWCDTRDGAVLIDLLRTLLAARK